MAQLTATQSDSDGVPVISAPGFVGRDRELASLAQALAGPPAVVLIEGEAGIGKSRLLREFLTSRPGQGQALVSCCPPFRQPYTLGPVVDAVRQAADDVAGLRLSPLAGALRPLFSEWADRLPPPPEPLDDAQASRFRVFRALAELLDGLDVRLLVAEDVHWADDATLEFLLFLATRQPPQVSLLVTYRPEDVLAGSLLRRLSSRLAAQTTRLCLRPLDVSETTGLISSMFGDEHVSEEFAAFLHDCTEGVPLAVEESVRLLCERADVVRRDGRWVRHNIDQFGVPPTVRDAVLERADRLTADARAILQAAAVLAEPAAEPVLIAVSGIPASRVRAGLSDALTSGLLTENFLNGQGLVSFRHVLAARAIYEVVPGPGRREMHLRAAQVLENASPLPVAQLVRHFREAGATGDWCRYGEQAADLALAAGDDNTAAVLLHDLIVNAGLAAGMIVRLARKVHIMALPGYAPVGDIARSLRSILNSDALTPEQRAEVGSMLGDILMDTGDWETGAAELEGAIPGLAHRPVEAAKAMMWLGWPCQALWPAGKHRRWLDRAAAMATDPSIPARDRLKLLADRASGLLLMGDEEGWAAVAGLLEEADTAQNALALAVGWLNAGVATMPWGQYTQTRELLASSLRLAGRYEHPRVRDCVLVALAHIDWFTGAWKGLAGRTESLAGLADVEPLVPAEAVLVAGLLDVTAGAVESAEKKLRLVLDEVTRRGVVSLPQEPAAAMARLRLAGGHPEEALALTENPMRIVTAKGIWLWATDVAPVRVRALAATGQTGEAAKLVTAFARGLGDLAAAPAPQAALMTCRAILAEGLAEHARAAMLFDRAAEGWQELPRPYDALLARENQSRCLLNSGQRDAGLTLLTEVLEGLSRLGASADVGRVERSLRERGAPVWRGWRGGRRGYGDQLSPRELEAVRLLVAGRSTREIAETLCRSPKTVNMQLTSAMRKLAVPSRVALVARAIESGVVADTRP